MREQETEKKGQTHRVGDEQREMKRAGVLFIHLPLH